MSWNFSKANGFVASMVDEGFQRCVSQPEEPCKQNCKVVKRLIDVVVFLTTGGRSLKRHTVTDEISEQGLFFEVANR